nr:hypothetical protein CFP56_63403 [Quercus suber]POE94753.1 hypothetical protein CFP56_16990 [Quercus suber]
MPSVPPRFIYSPIAPSRVSTTKSPPSTTQIILYSSLALGLVLVAALLCALLHRLRARRARAKSRETRKRAMIAAAAARIVERDEEAMGKGKWDGGGPSESKEGIKMCCYRRNEENDDGQGECSLEREPDVVLPRGSLVSGSLRVSRLGGDWEKERFHDVASRKSSFGFCWKEGKEGAMMEVKEKNIKGDENMEEFDKKNQIAQGQNERNDEPVAPPSAHRQYSVKVPEPCLVGPATRQDRKMPASTLPPGISFPEPSTIHLLVKSDDMFQRRNKAKSLELLHLKSRLAYPASVHSPPGRAEKVQQNTSSNRMSVTRWICGEGRLQVPIAMKTITDNREGREESWQTLHQRTTDLDMLHAKECNTLHGAVSVDSARKSCESGRQQGAKSVLDSQWSGVSWTKRSTGTQEDEWEDVSDMGSLATRSSEISLCASPTRAREL